EIFRPSWRWFWVPFPLIGVKNANALVCVGVAGRRRAYRHRHRLATRFCFAQNFPLHSAAFSLFRLCVCAFFQNSSPERASKRSYIKQILQTNRLGRGDWETLRQWPWLR